MTLGGAEATNPQAMGVYRKVASSTQGDRPLYRRVGSTVVQYLFYSPSFSSWRIGADYTVGSAFVSTGATEALCPEQATGWLMWNGSAWASEYPVKVVPGALAHIQ